MKKRVLAALLALLTLCACPLSLANEPAPTYADRYWKLDAKGMGALPSGYRTMEDAFPEKGGALPTREGMDTLCISGSGQYNADQFANMIADIRTKTDAAICVFDLRQETHGFADGQALSLYAANNAGNAGLDTDAVTALETTQLNELAGKELTLKSSGAKRPGSGHKKDDGTAEATAKPTPTVTPAATATPQIVEVTSVMTEAELCASQNVLYVRLACTDHLCPTDENVDAFLAAYRALPEGTWLHFHCAAGVGRTGLFMMMADILRDPEIPLDDIIARQVLLGANDPRSDKGAEGEESGEKTALLENFYDYVHLYSAGQDAPSFSEYRAGLK